MEDETKNPNAHPNINTEWRQQAFVEAYCADPQMDGARAAVAAGYKDGPYAKSQASRLLALPEVQEKIKAEMAKRAERTGITQDKVLSDLVALSEVDITTAYTDDWKPKPFLEIPRDTRRLIAKIKVTEFGPQLEFEDRNSLRKLLAQHMGIGITTKHQHEGKLENPLAGLTLEQLLAVGKAAKKDE